MFGRQRQMSYFSPYPVYPSASNEVHPMYINRNMPVQNSYYPSHAYQPFLNGMPTNTATSFSPYYYPNAMPSPSEQSWQGGASGYGQKQTLSQLLFENPLQAQPDNAYGGGHFPNYPNQNMNPYPQQAYQPKQPGGFHNVMNSFKNQDGHLDLNKMVDTAGQMMNAVTQVSSMVKGLGGFFKASV
jgi:hypothetical protein